MWTRLGATAALGLTLMAVLAAGASGGRTTASSEPSVLTYTDPAGDSAGAPDITNVKISGDAGSGIITFTVTATGFKPASPDGMSRSVDVWLDTDRDSSTGSPTGSEYVFYVWDDQPDPGHYYWSLDRWNGSKWEMEQTSGTTYGSRSGDVFTMKTITGDIGGAKSFDIHTSSALWDSSGFIAGDSEDGMLTWVYDISGPTKSMTKVVLPAIAEPAMAPAKVVAGGRVTVTFAVSWTPDKTSMPLTGGTMVCDPSVGGKVIPHAESFKNGVARLSFVVPRTAKGKTLKVKVTITAPTTREADGVWIGISGAEMGVMATYVGGGSTTKIVNVPIR